VLLSAAHLVLVLARLHPLQHGVDVVLVGQLCAADLGDALLRREPLVIVIDVVIAIAVVAAVRLDTLGAQEVAVQAADATEEAVLPMREGMVQARRIEAVRA
jgi:hypothetical protein